MRVPDPGVIAHVISHAGELKEGIQGWTAEEMQSSSQSIMRQRRAGDESHALLAKAVALCREAAQRATGRWPADGVVGAAAAGAQGIVAFTRGAEGARIAMTMVGYWFGLAGAGVHLVTQDDDRARSQFAFLKPVLALLGGDVGLVAGSMISAERRSAYNNMITVGAYSQFAADYLRDNLHLSQAEVVQRGQSVALVDDVGIIMVDCALTQVLITAPRTGPSVEKPEAAQIAARLLRGVEYKVRRRQRAIEFRRTAMQQIKQAVGWHRLASIPAVTLAQQVEDNILRRERLIAVDERHTLAEITVQGYLRQYQLVTGISSKALPDVSALDRVYGLRSVVPSATMRAGFLKQSHRTKPDHRGFVFERIVDGQRSRIYRLRAKIRAESDVRASVQLLVVDVVRNWSIRGAEAIIAGLSDALKGHQTVAQTHAVGDRPGTVEELADRAVHAIQQAIEQRYDTVGVSTLLDIFQEVRLNVNDLQWREHLTRLRFLQRHADTLYGLEVEALDAQQEDAHALFAASEQIMCEHSMMYFLNVRV